MLFNSIDFAVFLPIVFGLYWFVFQKNLKLQNALIVVASYVFYGWWDWRFLFLVLFSTILDYSIGLLLDREDKKSKRKFLLWCSIFVNLGFLGFFKYYNFFLDNFVTAFSFFGMSLNANSLNIILPVGISFYTFQTLSYTIDIYKNKLKPTKDFIGFSAFVSFFPQLVAGPIERASNLLPQFHQKRKFEYAKAVDGTRQILWGLFKKVVIADNCAEFANQIFNNSADLNGSTLFIGVLFFAFQIYGDFSGYSDIAIGTARLFGFNLMQNFAHPFFSRSIPEFWKRWHISLTTWFRDYMFVPLVRAYPINTFTKILNIFILFVVIGFWHGASWNFILWGVFLAICYIGSMYTNKKRKESTIVAEGRTLPTLSELYHMLSTFLLFVIAMIFFRAQTLEQVFLFFREIFSLSLFEAPTMSGIDGAIKTAIFLLIFILIEWRGRDKEYAIEKLGLKWKKPLRYGMYYLLIFTILWFAGREQEFIYFQF